jgi:hypothetical protein
MKCTNFILQIILIYEITVITNSLQQIIPSDISQFNANPKNYQNILGYYQLLNSVNNLGPIGMTNPLGNLNLNSLSGVLPTGLHNLAGLNNLGSMNNQVNPTQLVILLYNINTFNFFRYCFNYWLIHKIVTIQI